LLPALEEVDFSRIPTIQDRFGLLQQTYLALDSEAAWTAWFGAEAPPADPPVDWAREFVLFASLGPQAAGSTVDVGSIVQRNSTVSVWLTATVPVETPPIVGETTVPRVMMRVDRDELAPSGGLVFAFLDVQGRLLAQGPAGADALPLAGAQAAAGLEMLSKEGEVPLGAAPAPEAESAQPAGETATGAEAIPPATGTAPWVYGLGALAVIALALILTVVIRRFRRQH
jgi:hypothetical protein